jgi:hypothetical protein
LICARHLAVYRTDRRAPLALIADFHCCAIVDCAWVGLHALVLCSTDGFASIVRFDPELLDLEDQTEPLSVLTPAVQSEEESETDDKTVEAARKPEAQSLDQPEIKKRRIQPVLVTVSDQITSL